MRYSSNLLKPIAWNLEIDLVADMQTMLYDRLVKAGYRNVDLDRALYQYFNVQKRMIACRPRKLHKSKEFMCPELYEEALDDFEKKVKRGASLMPFLSNKLFDASYSDGMLNDWNIYHFHLTKRFNEEGWAKRSDYELFAYVTGTDMYLLQVYEHKDPLLYWRRELVRILNDNWPELLDKFHLKEVRGLTEEFDDEQYKQLREAHVTTLIELGENQVFGMIGGGYMSDGSSGEALRAADFWHNRLKIIENFLVENMDILCGLMKQVSESDTKEYKIKLLWVDSEHEFTFCELIRHVIIQLNTKDGYWRACQPFEVFGFEKSYVRELDVNGSGAGKMKLV